MSRWREVLLVRGDARLTVTGSPDMLDIIAEYRELGWRDPTRAERILHWLTRKGYSRLDVLGMMLVASFLWWLVFR